MRLSNEGLKDRALWKEAGYSLPEYDREAMALRTRENPFWVHFGAGNIFRAFQAKVVQDLLNAGVIDRGIIAVEGYDYDVVLKAYRPYDNYSVLVTLKADGRIEKTVIGSVAESCVLDSEQPDEFARVRDIFRQDSLQMASFTITEYGYRLIDGNGNFLPDVVKDLEAGPVNPSSYMGKITSLVYTRYVAGEKPIALVSMDNCSHNGEKLYNAVHTIAEKWVENSLVPAGFISYLDDSKKVAFPWTMIDKITPRPDDSILKLLKDDGIEDMNLMATSKHTYASAFVNAEECQYLVIEDSFPNGRPQLEKGGLIFTDRGTVDKVERMKVCTCLNPLHTALAVFGCLLGYTRISDEMKDDALRTLVEKIGYAEGLPVVTDPKVLDLHEFIDTVIKKRLPNPFIPDTPQRIAMDTSQKLPIRYGETVKAYAKSDTLKVSDLKFIPLVYAGWMRYLMGVDDMGNPFEITPDPMKDFICPVVSDISLGDKIDAGKVLQPLLKNTTIWGFDLYETGMAGQVCGYFNELIAGTGAVRKTLEKYTGCKQ